ncbi:MAG: fibronectin type III domain-containing protein, partial [Sphingobacteriales bacterium]
MMNNYDCRDYGEKSQSLSELDCPEMTMGLSGFERRHQRKSAGSWLMSLWLPVLLLFALTGFSQSVLVGTGTTQGNPVPYDVNYGYSYVQTIYPQTALGYGGSITGLQFFLPSAATVSSSNGITVWLGHTAKTAFSSTTDWIPVGGLTQVFTGTVTNSSGIVNVTFATPFAYNNTDNLVLVVDENVAGYNASTDRYYSNTGVTNNTIYARSDTVNPDPTAPPTGTRSISRANVRFLGIGPSCASPTGLASSNATTTSATISWAAANPVPANGYEYYYNTTGTAPVAATTASGSVGAGVLTANLSGLTSGSSYSYWVRSVCGAGKSDWSSVATLFTLAPGQLGAGSATTTANPINSCYGYNYSQQIYLASEINAINPPGQNYITKIRFKPTSVPTDPSTFLSYNIFMGNTTQAAFASTTNWIGSASLQQVFAGNINFAGTAGTWVEITLGTPFLWDGTSNVVVAVDENTASYSCTASWAAYSASANRAIVYYNDSTNPSPSAPPTASATSALVPQMQIVTSVPPSCLPPTISISALTYNSANASWSAQAGASSGYDWELRTSGAVESGPTGLIQNGNTANTTLSFTGLVQGTIYTLYVRSNCGSSQSVYSSTSFTTYPVAPTPYSEGFATAALPANWSATNFGVTSNYNAGTPSGNPGNFAFVNLYGSTPSATLTTTNIGLVQAGMSFSLDYRLANYDSPYAPPGAGSGNFIIAVSTDYGATFTNLQTVANDAVAGWRTLTIPLTAYVGQVIKVRVTATRISGDYVVALDNFKVEVPPTCFPPTALTVVPGSTAANFSWTAASPAPSTGYDWEIRSSGAAGSGATGLAASGSVAAGVTTASATNLTALTAYTLYVRSHCDATDLSSWASTTFSTLIANDNFNDAIAVSCGSTYTGDTTTATSDQTNPAIFGVAASTALTRNIWYKFTGTGTPQTVTVSLCESGFDTSLLIATGTSGSLNYLSGNEDFCGSSGFRSEAAFTSDGTTTYYIMVRGYSDSSYGAYSMVVTCAAACTPFTVNDECTAATPVTVGTPLASGNNCASPSSNAAYPSCGSSFGTYYDSWYSFNSGSNTVLEFSATAVAPVIVGYAVYSGTCASPVQVSGSCSTTGSATNVTLTADTNYYVRVFSTSATARGNYTLSVKVPCLVPTALSASNLNYFSATLGWTASTSAPAGGYEYEVRSAGAAGSGATGLAASGTLAGNSVEVTGLAHTTAYTAYVRSVCGAGDTSPWVSTTFSTLTPPVISIASFNPTSICDYETLSTPVTLTGSGFTGATSVTLGTENLPFTVVNDNTITVSLMSSSANGTFTVANSLYGTSATSASTFTIKTSPVVEPITGATSVCSGSTITLSTASSAGTWSSSNIDVATVSGGVVTGVIAGTAVISYSISENGCTSSQSLTVTVTNALAVSNPMNVSALENSPAAFSVATSNGSTYQWQVSSDNETFVNLSNNATYANTSGTASGTVTLNILVASSDLSGLYYRVVVNGNGPCGSVTTESAILTVGQTGIVPGTPAPAVLCSTGSGVANFTVQTTGDVNFYNWFVDKNLAEGVQPIDPIADGLTYDTSVPGTLSISGITIANNGWIYYVEAGSTEFGTSVFASATLTVNTAPSISSNGQPANQTACGNQAGSKVFSVTATGSGLTYAWEYSADGTTFQPIAASTPAGVTYTGGATASLTVNYSATTASGTYFYRAIVSGASPCGSATSDPAQLQITSPVISAGPVAASVSKGGPAATFSVTTSAPSPTYQWQYADAVGGTYANVVNGTPAGVTYSAIDNTLSVTAGATAAASNLRYYRAIVTSGGCSTTSAPAQLTIIGYCTPAPTSVDGIGITNVTIGTINNTTVAETNNYG